MGVGLSRHDVGVILLWPLASDGNTKSLLFERCVRSSRRQPLRWPVAAVRSNNKFRRGRQRKKEKSLPLPNYRQRGVSLVMILLGSPWLAWCHCASPTKLRLHNGGQTCGPRPAPPGSFYGAFGVGQASR